jgi:two-component system OmpR family sensor kinase
LLIWILVSRGLQPLARIASSVKARTPDSLEPLQEIAAPEEVKPLVFSLNDLLARLKSALDAQRAFVADAAHELRTPLTALQLQVQLVERANSDEDRAAALGELKSGLQRTIHAVQQLLTLARQEPGAAEYRITSVSLADLIRRSVLEHERLAEARAIDLGVTQADEAAHISGDADALRILLANLVSNALRYTPAGGRVDVACGLMDGGAYFEVADTGPGIPAAERERVFDRFYRRGGDSADGNTGSGLGLSIVRTIADRHGAQVSLADSESGGLLVRVCFSSAKVVSG